jgi:hypothetical protein
VRKESERMYVGRKRARLAEKHIFVRSIQKLNTVCSKGGKFRKMLFGFLTTFFNNLFGGGA